MSLYLNCAFADGEKMAVEVATVRGWGDFSRWAMSLPKEFDQVRELAQKGHGKGSKSLEDELRKAMKSNPPKPSAEAVATILADVVPYSGELAVSEEPEDSELE